MKNITGIIFDFDGVIVDSKKALYDYQLYVCKKYSKIFPYGDIDEYTEVNVGKSFIKIYREMGFDWEKDQKKLKRDYRDIMNKAKTPVFRGIPEVLEKIKKMNIKIGMASNNISDVVNNKLSELKLKKYFAKIICFDEIKSYKPYPNMINKVMKDLHLKPGETVYLGDMVEDIQAAKKAAVPTAAVLWGYHKKKHLQKEKPDFFLEEPKNIIDILVDKN